MTLSPQTIQNLSPDIAFFRFSKQKSGGGHYLITNDIGQYSYLTPEEFHDFCTGNLDGTKKDELTEKLFYKTPEYEEKMVELYNRRNSFLAFGPSLHIIVTTLRCTHKCNYCHAAVAPMTAKGLDMSLETAEKVVDTIFYTSSPTITIEFQGGESLVNWNVVQFIVEYAQMKAQALEKHLTFSLVTNLSLMDDKKLTWLLDRGVDICTSLDGDKLTHNGQRIWKEGDSFESVSHWMKKIREEMIARGASQEYAVGALATWTKKSIKRYKEIIDTYCDLGLKSIGFRWLNPYGFALADKDAMEFTIDEFKSLYRNGMDYILQINRDGYKLKEMITTVYLDKIFNNRDGGFMDIRSPAGIATGMVAYNYDGKVYAGDDARMLGRMGIQDFLMTPLLDTGTKTYKAMANSDVTKIAVSASTLDGIPGYNDHVYKPYMGVDLAYNFTQYGNIYSNFSKDEKNQTHVFILDYIFEKLQDPATEKIFRSWLNS